MYWSFDRIWKCLTESGKVNVNTDEYWLDVCYVRLFWSAVLW